MTTNIGNQTAQFEIVSSDTYFLAAGDTVVTVGDGISVGNLANVDIIVGAA